MYGYLFVTKNSLLMFREEIAADYWSSIVEMKKINKQKKKNYSCCVICLDCSQLFRYKLSWQTGIPLKRITTANLEKAKIIIGADSLVDFTFCGNVKIYDNENNVPKKHLNSCLEIEYI